MSKAFFGIVTLAMVTVAVLQFVLGSNLQDQCSHNLQTAPYIAGTCVVVSLGLVVLWLEARHRNLDMLVRFALFVWTGTVTAGTIAAGATLGQIHLYEDVCPSLHVDFDAQAMQYASVVLLLFSIATPHCVSRHKKNADAEAVEAEEEQKELLKKPIQFEF